MRLHGFTGNDIKEEFNSFTTIPPGLFFYRDVGVAIFTWLELRSAIGYDFGYKPITTHYATVEEFLLHEMPTFDMTEPSEEEFSDPKKRAKAWKRKKEAARRKFYADIDKLASVGLARLDQSGDLHLEMGARGDKIEADRARRKAKRAHRRGETTAEETVTPAPRKVASKALAKSTTPVDDKRGEVRTDAVPVMDEATKRARSFQQREVARQAWRDEEPMRKWEEERRKRESDEAEMEAFAEWLDFHGDAREIWDNKNEWGYQDYLNSLNPKSQPANACNTGDDYMDVF